VRFEKREDCYWDGKTGLEWSLENYGPMAWNDAVDFCDGLGNGWRLPTIEELMSLIDFSKVDPATELPECRSSHYWSGSPYAYNTAYAWGVYFDDGAVYGDNKTGRYYVRAVRGEIK